VDRSWRVLEAVEGVARRIGSTPAAVSLAWLLARPGLSSVIVGARTEAQLVENLDALSVKIPPEDLAELDRVSTPDWGYPQSFIGSREPW
jgi:aryl-alcohol dehydrogenase-like predicted oxidoreductase